MTPILLDMLSGISRLSASLLVSATIEASLLTLALALALRLFPRIPAVLRFGLWTAVLAASVVLPFVPMFTRSSTAAAPRTMLHADIRWSFAVAALWAVLTIVRTVQLVRSMVHLRAVARRSVPVENVLCTTPDSGRIAVLCTSDDVLQPSVIGFLAPRILIPSGLYSQLSRAELEHIVLHEMEHLRRRDDWINLLQKIVLILFPLNPVLFWVERRLCLERELACDDSVLRATQTPKSYASCLVHLAESRIFGHQLPLALGAWGRKSELTRRVHHILEPTRKRMTQPQTAMAIALIGAGLVGGAALLSRTPQLVSFEAQPSAAVTASVREPMPHPSAIHNVALTTANGPRATLVKATMPLPRTRPARRTVEIPVPRAIAIDAAPGRPSVEPQQHWVLTTWTYQSRTTQTPVAMDESDAPRLTFTVVETRQRTSSYAAVATANGWLIIQL
jgi:beta-lactamase regulating signal transducer with metallopeptidase domain